MLNTELEHTAKADNEEIDLDVLANLVGFHLRIAQLYAFQRFTDTLKDFEDVSPPLFAALIVIRANPGISQTRLGDLLYYNKATLVGLTRTMEKRGFLIRKRDPKDRRYHALYLTEEGKALADNLKIAVTDRVEKQLSSSLSKQDHEQLIELLKRVYLGSA